MRNLSFSIALLILTTMFSSCFQHYYTTHSLTPLNESDVAILREKGRQVFVHYADRTMLANVASCNDGMLEGTLAALPQNQEPVPVADHKVGLHKESYSNMDRITTQVHVFTKQVHSPENESLVLPLVDIREIQYQSYDAGSSTLSHIAGFAAIILAIMVTAGGMIALSGGVTGPLSLNNLGI